MCGETETIDSTFRALAVPRRRIALQCLQHHGTVSLADLAELVVEHETSAELVQISAERVKRVYFSLYHTHVPLLVDAGLAWYEQPDDLVGVTERTRSVLTTVRDKIETLIPE